VPHAGRLPTANARTAATTILNLRNIRLIPPSIGSASPKE
jgi:hypothetical protein